MHQTDGIYWHDYILICLFASRFAKHGLVLLGSLHPSILLLNTLKYTHVCSKFLKKFYFVYLISFLSCYVFVNLGEKELHLVISFSSAICREHIRLVHHVKVFLVGMKLCAVYSLLKVLAL
jgi:hypothetical protein